METKRIRFGLVGCGNIGTRHAEHIANLGILAAVCDTNIQRAQEMAGRYACPYYGNIEAMLASEKDLGVVSVCTPNGLHREHTIQSLAAGHHVLCEKPMAICTRDCLAMMEAEQRAGKKLFIVKQNRFNPPVMALKRAITMGKLGRVFNVQVNCFWNRSDRYYAESPWKGNKLLDGGILFTQFSHFVDLLYWMVGDVKTVSCLTHNYLHAGKIEFEDTGVALLQFENDALGTINFTINSFAKNFEGSLTVFAEHGTVKIGGQYLNVLEYQNIRDYEIVAVQESRPPNEYGFYQGSMSNHDKVYENIIDVLLHDGEIATNSQAGLKTVEIIEKIYRAAAGQVREAWAEK
jgi:UDP-N-acetyl-2-amino-2-deoxyglucuronate dehydrogenase